MSIARFSVRSVVCENFTTSALVRIRTNIDAFSWCASSHTGVRKKNCGSYKIVISRITNPANSPLTKIPKRMSTPPALASPQWVVGGGHIARPSKKNVLFTREKLRAGLHDPKGLLDLVGFSTNALERTKKIEQLKSSGLLVKP